MALIKYCSKCNIQIPYGCTMCEQCEDKYLNRLRSGSKQRYKDYNHNKRDIVTQAFYNSKEWKQAREAAKIRDKGLCRLCYSLGKINYIDNVHHIEPIKESPDLKTDINNLICLCNQCHKQTHNKYDRQDKQIKKKLKNIINDRM